MATTRSPKFFKIVVNPQDNKLKIPTGFIRKYRLSLPDMVTLKAPGGSEKEIKLVQYDGDTWLDKGWEEFRDYYSIRLGHVLVFEYDGESHFNVSILDLTTVEIEYPLEEDNSDETEVNGSESDGSAEIMKEYRRSLKGKRKRSYGKDKFSRATNGQLSKTRITTIKGREACVAYQRAKAFQSDNPFCICLMQQSHITYPTILNIPLHFAKEALGARENKHKLRLHIPGKGTWDVIFSLLSGRARLNAGWDKFVMDNALEVEDACVFEVVDKRDKLLWNVTIFRS